jgi:uncharacterized protein YdbL (DUF1318 family)
MTAGMSLLFPVIVSALTLAVMALLGGMILSWRAIQRQAAGHAAAQMAHVADLLGAHKQQIESLLEHQAAERHVEGQQLAQNVETIQADIEWLAGEKMIEQAVSLVRDNMPLSQISQSTGLSHDTIRTLAQFRTH